MPETKTKLNEWAQQRIKPGIAAPGEALDVWPMVADYNSVDRYRRLPRTLQKRGWSEARLEKLLGGNFLRVYREAWGGCASVRMLDAVAENIDPFMLALFPDRIVWAGEIGIVEGAERNCDHIRQSCRRS